MAVGCSAGGKLHCVVAIQHANKPTCSLHLTLGQVHIRLLRTCAMLCSLYSNTPCSTVYGVYVRMYMYVRMSNSPHPTPLLSQLSTTLPSHPSTHLSAHLPSSLYSHPPHLSTHLPSPLSTHLPHTPPLTSTQNSPLISSHLSTHLPSHPSTHLPSHLSTHPLTTLH